MAEYTTITLHHPWGESKEEVRIFPPCEVKNRLNRNDTAVIFVKDPRSRKWQRKQIPNYYSFPDGFIAWDDKNEEYAWHDVGTIDVPSAKDPYVSKSIQALPTKTVFASGGAGHVHSVIANPIIRGESEVVGGPSKSEPSRARRGHPRQRFLNWWASKSRAPETLDFLRKGN